MDNATIFKQAHAMTKATIKAGDSYHATFALCLKLVIEQNKAQAVAMVESKEKAQAAVKALVSTISEALYQLTIGGFCVGMLAAFVMFFLHVATGTPHAWLSVVGGFVAVSFAMFGSWLVAEAVENVRHDCHGNTNP